MNIIELILDEENNEIGIEAISVVENPYFIIFLV